MKEKKFFTSTRMDIFFIFFMLESVEDFNFILGDYNVEDVFMIIMWIWVCNVFMFVVENRKWI